MTTGLHTATLIFADSAATLATNQWQFFVANQNVLGYWKFNEHKTAARHFKPAEAGSILELSNGRNGTANSAMSYVAGSFNFGNSPALRFTTSPDHVMVPDPSGVFIFTNSFTMEAVNPAPPTSPRLRVDSRARTAQRTAKARFWWRFPGAAGGKQEVGMNNQLFVIGTNALNDGQWHHVAVVYNQTNNEVDLYADYVLVGIGHEGLYRADRPPDGLVPRQLHQWWQLISMLTWMQSASATAP